MFTDDSNTRWRWFRVRTLLFFTCVHLTQMPSANASTTPAEEGVLEILRESFSQPTWVGNPCESVDWISCSVTNSSGFQSVTSVSLPGKKLSGTIPAAVGNLTQLLTVSLSNNQLTGPIPDLTRLENLTTLDLGFNSLSGTIPEGQNITYLWLNNNNLIGGIPASAFQYSKIKDLQFQDNPLGGPIPDLSQLTNIGNLNLSNCKLNGTVPASINLLAQMTTLYMQDNPELEGPLPDLSGLAAFQFFGAENCRLSGPLPDLKNAKGMQKLYLYNNRFNGTIPPALFLHTNLRYLRLDQNPELSGQIPDMSQLVTLSEFYANECNFSGALPDSLPRATLLKVLDLHGNQFTSVPSDLRNLTRVLKIDLSDNIINGPLPDLPAGANQPDEGYRLQWLILTNNNFSGGIPDSWARLNYLNGMIVGSNSISGEIPKALGNLSNLLYMNLSSNMLSGSIPDELGLISTLKVLDLRNNQLSGTIPEALAQLKNLEQLRLDNNNFTAIPEAILKMNLLNLTYSNNPDLRNITKSATSSSGVSAGAIGGIVAGVLVAGIVVLAIVVYFICGKKEGFLFDDEEQLYIEDMPKSVQFFTLKEIKSITENNKTLVGKGGFGQVYYGKLSDGKEVAVKVRAADSKQGSGEFLNEVRLLSRLHHRNLVPLIGYCVEAHQQILVYAYMSEGTLHDHLYHHTGCPSDPAAVQSTTWQPLGWKTRLDIAMNSARGLEYLHKDCNPSIIHRDVKTSNILLTDKLYAKVADLGISKQAYEQDEEDMNRSGISTAIKGTIGYLDPEYFIRHKLTTKSDVYSFGMVLLEIITGRRPQTQRYPGSEETNLMDWVRVAVESNTIESIVDPILPNEYNREGMLKVARLALSCVGSSGASRPDMGDIVRTLIEVLHMEGAYTETTTTTSTREPLVSLSGQLQMMMLPFSPGSSNTGSSLDPNSHSSWDTHPR